MEECAMARRMNPTAAALLGLLEDCGELTGGQLVRVADQRIGDYWSLTRSQVYRELATLAAQGDVVAGDPGPREAQPYRISVSYTHLRAHETDSYLVCRLL